MNKLDKQYTELLQDILDNGVSKTDRTGTGTISVFGRQIRHDMKDGFPLLTTKKMPWKVIVTELLWFLRGDTNIKYLVDNGCNIWNGDAYKNYESNWLKENPPMAGPYTDPCLTMDEFIEKIKTDLNFASGNGELGPIYGKQWRSWKSASLEEQWGYGEIDGHPIGGKQYSKFNTNVHIDQIQNLINDLKTNPDSRRLMVNAWNVGELDQMVLPPCHYGFQVYTRELSLEERTEYKKKRDGIARTFAPYSHQMLDNSNIPTRTISLMWNQRSVDTFLGLPFNIASYGLLLEIIAKEVNMVPDQLIGNLGDVHLYSNHIGQAREQIGEPIDHEKRHELLKEAMGDEAYKNAIDELEVFGGGLSGYYDSYKIPHTTREPYQLPTLKIVGYPEEYNYPNDERLFKEFEVSDFKIENYQSHPTIKAQLSN
jgi:thymidylate synthase